MVLDAVFFTNLNKKRKSPYRRKFSILKSYTDSFILFESKIVDVIFYQYSINVKLKFTHISNN